MAVDGTSERNCLKFNKRHHLFICDSNSQDIVRIPQLTEEEELITTTVCAIEETTDESLPTAMLSVNGHTGKKIIRCLFDSGSSKTYVSQQLVEELAFS